MASLNSNNTALLFSLLVIVSAFMAAPSSVEAQSLPGLPNSPRLVNMSGTVYCAPSVNVSSNGSTVPPNVPPFANATLILKCGNTIVANSTTNASGIFSIVATYLPISGTLQSPLLGISINVPITENLRVSSGSFQLVNSTS